MTILAYFVSFLVMLAIAGAGAIGLLVAISETFFQISQFSATERAAIVVFGVLCGAVVSLATNFYAYRYYTREERCREAREEERRRREREDRERLEQVRAEREEQERAYQARLATEEQERQELLAREERRRREREDRERLEQAKLDSLRANIIAELQQRDYYNMLLEIARLKRTDDYRLCHVETQPERLTTLIDYLAYVFECAAARGGKITHKAYCEIDKDIGINRAKKILQVLEKHDFAELKTQRRGRELNHKRTTAFISFARSWQIN